MRGRQLTRLLTHLKVAEAYAGLSHANRLKVGAVLVKDDRVISVGYNGTPSGQDNVCETTNEYNEVVTKLEVVHAEMNVIAFAAKDGISTNGTTMVMTHSPCFECCKLIVQSGVKEVYYKNQYRILDGLKLLQDCGVKVKQL